MINLGVFYNAEIRNNGTARRVTESLHRMGYTDAGMKRYNRPPYEEEVKKHDLHLFIDDGRDDIPYLPPSPNACWLVDTHLGYDTRLKWAKEYDTTFVAQKPAVEKMKADGVENVYWLPLACLPCVDPNQAELRREGALKNHPKKDWDVSFVGYINNGPEDGEGNNRLEYLHEVFQAFPNSWLAYNKFFIEAAIRAVKSKVAFNISIKDDLNMRFFEILSYGVCQVANVDVVGWEELGFVEGKHFLGYTGPEEACEKIQWALDNPMDRENLAREGNRFVRAEHTYENRLTKMFDTIGV
jgi:hypothetical protein